MILLVTRNGFSHCSSGLGSARREQALKWAVPGAQASRAVDGADGLALTAWRRPPAREARNDDLPHGLDLDHAGAGGPDRSPGLPAGSRFSPPC
jgi:hypothetical protein